MEIKEGYKRTEVGVIPVEWECVELSECVDYIKGFPFKSKDYRMDGIRIIRVSDTTYNSIKDEAGVYVDFLRYKEFQNWKLCEDDIILSTVGSKPPMFDSLVGKAILISQNYAGSLLNQNAVILRSKVVNQNLIYANLKRPNYIKHIEKIFRGNANQASITLKDLFKFKFALPIDTQEQQAIATALSDIDKLISSITKLIDKKKNIKQGAMQELLTGKKRLAGFGYVRKEIESDSVFNIENIPEGYKKTEVGVIPKDWEYSYWSDVLDGFTGGATPYRAIKSYYCGSVKWITSGELNYNVIYNTLECITDEAREKTNLKIHPVGTFLMAITGLEAEGTRGSCGIIGSPATTNQSCMAIYGTEKMKIEYLYYYYIKYGNELALKYCQGTKQQSYTAKIVKQLPIVYPPTLIEQAAIATVLSDMDEEIETLTQKLKKYKNIKQGMMQELLTGRIRLV